MTLYGFNYLLCSPLYLLSLVLPVLFLWFLSLSTSDSLFRNVLHVRTFVICISLINSNNRRWVDDIIDYCWCTLHAAVHLTTSKELWYKKIDDVVAGLDGPSALWINGWMDGIIVIVSQRSENRAKSVIVATACQIPRRPKSQQATSQHQESFSSIYTERRGQTRLHTSDKHFDK